MTHVCVVEDDSFLAGIYQKKFEAEGFKVTRVDNGARALAEIKKKKPDVILLEVLLPQVDGFTVLGQLKADSTVHYIPVILLTNLGQKSDVEKGLNLGAADYLIKAHHTPMEIIEKVREVLRKVRS